MRVRGDDPGERIRKIQSSLRMSATWLRALPADTSILIKTKSLHPHFPILVGPGGAALDTELRISVGLDFPFVDHADLDACRHGSLMRLAFGIDPGVLSAVRKLHALRPFRPQAFLRRRMGGNQQGRECGSNDQDAHSFTSVEFLYPKAKPRPSGRG